MFSLTNIIVALLLSLASAARQSSGQQSLEMEMGKKVHGLEHRTVSQMYMEHQNEQRMPRLIPNQDIYLPEQMEEVEKFLYAPDELHGNCSVSEFGLMALNCKVHTLVYNDMLMHRYETFKDLKESSGPKVDHELCLKQLEQLNERARRASEVKFTGMDLNLHRLLDTYGRPPAGMFLGSSLWPGMYGECLRMKIDVGKDVSKVETRYCLAALKHKSWPKGSSFNEFAALKSGVCLPRSCDSMNYKNKYQLIQSLIEFNARDVDKDQAVLDYLYCLPDEESPQRQWWRQPKTVLCLVAFVAWLSLLIYSTIKYRILSGLSNGVASSGDESSDQPVRLRHPHLKIYRSLSILNNFKLLFDTTKSSTLLETGDKINASDKKRTTEDEQSESTGGSERKLARSPSPASTISGNGNGRPIVDLRCLEGIKVMCMCYVVMGHVLMCCTLATNNGREMTIISISNVTFFVANMVPAFAVNSFFTITGLLTVYLIFKKDQSTTLITDPKKWLAFIMYRYLRIMPMYVIVVIYTKYLSKFASSGPFWDYGTSSLAPRKMCEQESWLWSLLFAANFKPPLEHCIPSAWYLANDFQFFIVTPIFLAVLHQRPKLGQKLLKFCIWAGYFAGFISILSSDAQDLRPVANFMPHGFKTYVTFLSPSYTMPQYRIPAYLVGILIGYTLFKFEQDKLEYIKMQRECLELSQAHLLPKEPGWSEAFKKYGLFTSLLCVITCCALPLLSTMFKFNKLFARIIVAFFMSSYHLLFSLSIGLYILLATTGFGSKFVNQFLGASLWKPFARLSLCAVLINVEVISFIIQSRTQPLYLDFYSQTALNLLCICFTYLAAIVVCLLFEAPMRAGLNLLVALMVNKLASKTKGHHRQHHCGQRAKVE